MPRWKPLARPALAWSLYLYGSVATGIAKTPTSDVDLLTFGMDTELSRDPIGQHLPQSLLIAAGSVDIAVAQPPDLVGKRRCGVRQPGVPTPLLRSSVRLSASPRACLNFPADQHAAKGLNGDIDIHAERWRSDLQAGSAFPLPWGAE